MHHPKDLKNNLLHAKLHQPHSYLGMHALPAKSKSTDLVVRAFLQNAKSVAVIDTSSGTPYPMSLIAPEGLFEVIIPSRTHFPYQLRIQNDNGELHQAHDPYSFLPSVSETDAYLFNEGNHHRIYNKLGAHQISLNGVHGTSFAVWAPTARRVSVVGDFNHWDGRYHPMRSLGSSGIWELFLPSLPLGSKYKFEILSHNHQILLKSDPYALFYESPPHNASITADISHYHWNDASWLHQRKSTNWHEAPISAYEVHLSSWRRVVEDGDRPLSYKELATALSKYVKSLGFTHIELMPMLEHPFEGSWGYQVTGFFAPTHRFGSPTDFMHFVDTMHQNGIGVILDWVPAHFPKDSFALAHFDGSHLYEHADPRQGEHKDWGTLIFNYGRHEVKNFLLASALSWFDRFHIDGIRVDAVASMLYLDYSRKDGEWVPNQYGGKENIAALEFLRQLNDLVHHYYPGALMIAEESTAFSGITRPTKDFGVGFDFKWNMGWMHDNLSYFSKDPIHRKHHHNSLTFGMLYQYSENFISTFSHDEVVHGKSSMLNKMPSSDIHQKARHLRSLYAYMWAWPGKKTLFMGSEFGQFNEWQYDKSLDWHLLQYPDHHGIQSLIKDLNHWYTSATIASKDCSYEGFSWIKVNDADNSVVAFCRYGSQHDDAYLVVGNFTPVTRFDYHLGVPFSGYWKETINTDSSIYGGNNIGNFGGTFSEPVHWDGYPNRITLTLPGLSTLIFKFSPNHK